MNTEVPPYFHLLYQQRIVILAHSAVQLTIPYEIDCASLSMILLDTVSFPP